MAYIYINLEELKEILPVILDQWIDKEDESWEWIFQEIEQKCHVDKEKVGKNIIKKEYIKRNRADLDALMQKFQNLNKKVDGLERDTTILSARITTLASSMEGVKWMAQTAKQRTEIDYAKCSGKSDGNKMCKTCKHSSNIDGSPKSFDTPPCDSCNHNNKWEAKSDDT